MAAISSVQRYQNYDFCKVKELSMALFVMLYKVVRTCLPSRKTLELYSFQCMVIKKMFPK